MERLRANRSFASALSAITAAVVGCVLNLALWFALHVLFAEVSLGRAALWDGWLRLRWIWPQWSTLRFDALLITTFACVALLAWKRGLAATLLGSVALGIVLWWLR